MKKINTIKSFFGSVMLLANLGIHVVAEEIAPPLTNEAALFEYGDRDLDMSPELETPDVLTDTDADGMNNKKDTDDDNDGVLDRQDNCPLLENVHQENEDGDPEGDACDLYITDPLQS